MLLRASRPAAPAFKYLPSACTLTKYQYNKTLWTFLCFTSFGIHSVWTWPTCFFGTRLYVREGNTRKRKIRPTSHLCQHFCPSTEATCMHVCVRVYYVRAGGSHGILISLSKRKIQKGSSQLPRLNCLLYVSLKKPTCRVIRENRKKKEKEKLWLGNTRQVEKKMFMKRREVWKEQWG